MKTTTIAAVLATAVAVPSLPQQYSMILRWNTPAGYEYIHEEAIDYTNNRMADSAIANNSVTTMTVELPSSTGYSYIYDTSRKTCVETNITGSKIGGGIRTFPQMVNATTEVVDGINCDKWTMDLGSYNTAVWFSHDGGTPVQLYNSDDEAKGAITDGIKKVQCFTPGTAWDAFNIPPTCAPTTEVAAPVDTKALHQEQLKLGYGVPVVPDVCSYKIEWASKIAGRTYDYAHFQYYDIPNQKFRDNQLASMCKVVATTLELGGQGIDMAYHYDDVTLQCTTYPFTGLISQYILTYPDMELAATELVEGVLCNKWQKVFPPSPATPDGFSVAVWFTTHGATPVRLYNSHDEAMNTTVGGFKHISYFTTNVTLTDFTVPAGCSPSE